MTIEEEKEFKKCRKSPYYFATKYIKIKHSGTIKNFTTRLTEQEFNKLFKDLDNESNHRRSQIRTRKF